MTIIITEHPSQTTLTEDTPEMKLIRRLIQRASDQRFAFDAARLAVEAITHYDPQHHQFSDRKSYHDFFRKYCLDNSYRAKNIKVAIELFDLLLAERTKTTVSAP